MIQLLSHVNALVTVVYQRRQMPCTLIIAQKQMHMRTWYTHTYMPIQQLQAPIKTLIINRRLEDFRCLEDKDRLIYSQVCIHAPCKHTIKSK